MSSEKNNPAKPYAADCNLLAKQVGAAHCFHAPFVQSGAKPDREVCNPPTEPGSLIVCVGLHIDCKFSAQGRVLSFFEKMP